MNAGSIPISQKVVITDTGFIKGTITRVSEDEVVLEQFDPATGQLVLRIKVGIHSPTSAVEYIDQDFWTITVDGKAFSSGSEPARGDVDFDPKSRRINITTK